LTRKAIIGLKQLKTVAMTRQLENYRQNV